MTRDRSAHDTGNQAGLVELMEALSLLSPADRTEALRRLLATGLADPDPFERPPTPSRRRSRRPDVVTYVVRIELTRTKPPLWRRLELSSDLFLDEVHDILQVAFGWTDSHLHRFGCGPAYYSHETEYYLCPWEVREGEPGIPEEDVRLDEVLVDVDDRLFYVYDFGDGWEHTIKLEAVVPRDAIAPRAVCTKGRRDGPAEDCGGVYGYELIAAASDPTHPDHAELALEFARHYGDEVDPAAFDTTRFDLDEVNRSLLELGFGDAPAVEAELPEPLAALVHAVRTLPERGRLRRLLTDARLDEPVLIDVDTAARMASPYTWLLNHVGDQGITLTAAGYLPPAHVEEAVTALGMDDVWIGKGNRETLTAPVLHLRETAQKFGLLRKHRGKLSLTARGRELRSDPVALWWQLAARTPPKSRDTCETQAGLLTLIAVAAECAEPLNDVIAEFLDAIGWMHPGGMPLSGSAAAHAAWDTKAVLWRVGGLASGPDGYPQPWPTADGVTFARAALRTWP